MGFLSTLSKILGNKGVQAGLTGGGAILGGLLGSRPTSQQTTAYGAETNALNQLTNLSQAQQQISIPALQQASAYYSTLLGLPGGAGGVGGGGNPNPLGLTSLMSPTVGSASSPSGLQLAGQTGLGIGSGAATGAALGSVIPGLGTAIGAGIGGLVGAIGAPLSNIFHGAGGPPALAQHDSSIANAMTSDASKILAAEAAGTITPQQAYNQLNDVWNWASSNFQQGSWTSSQKQYMDQWLNTMASKGATAGGTAPPIGQGGSTGSLMQGVPAPAGYSSIGQMNAVQNLLSMPIQQTTAQFNAAKNNILTSMPPGGARDQALAQLEQSRTASLSNLFMGAQAKGAEGLVGVGAAMNPASTLGTLLSGASGLAQQGLGQQVLGQQTGSQIGSTIAQILFGQGGLLSGGKSSGSSTPLNYPSPAGPPVAPGT